MAERVYAVVVREVMGADGEWRCAEPQLMRLAEAEALKVRTEDGPHAARKRVSIVGKVPVTLPEYHEANEAKDAAVVAQGRKRREAQESYNRDLHTAGYHRRLKESRGAGSRASGSRASGATARESAVR